MGNTTTNTTTYHIGQNSSIRIGDKDDQTKNNGCNDSSGDGTKKKDDEKDNEKDNANDNSKNNMCCQCGEPNGAYGHTCTVCHRGCHNLCSQNIDDCEVIICGSCIKTKKRTRVDDEEDNTKPSKIAKPRKSARNGKRQNSKK